MSDVSNLMAWISNQGFPIAVAVYLLTRLEQKLDRLIDLVEKVIK